MIQRPQNLKVGELFEVIAPHHAFDMNQIVELVEDDGTICPFFSAKSGEEYKRYRSCSFKRLRRLNEPNESNFFSLLNLIYA